MSMLNALDKLTTIPMPDKNIVVTIYDHPTLCRVFMRIESGTDRYGNLQKISKVLINTEISPEIMIRELAKFL